MISTVIFDMDGLLFSTEPIYFECYKKAAAEQGLEFTFELFEACVGMSTEASSAFIRRHFGPRVSVHNIHQRTYDYFEKYLHEGGKIEFRPGAKEAVEFFHKRGLKIGLASSNIRRWADYFLQLSAITSYFSAITTREDVTRPKPDPEVYLTCAKRLGAETSQCLAFEDSVAGATAAIGAGMRTCVVPQIKQPNRFVREHAFKVYHSLTDIYPDMEELLA